MVNWVISQHQHIIWPAGWFPVKVTHRHIYRCSCCEVLGKNRSRSERAWTAPSSFPCKLKRETLLAHFTCPAPPQWISSWGNWLGTSKSALSPDWQTFLEYLLPTISSEHWAFIKSHTRCSVLQRLLLISYMTSALGVMQTVLSGL